MKPKSTRWHRNHTAVSEYYYKWEIDVMKTPESFYDTELAMKFIPVPAIQFMETVEN